MEQYRRIAIWAGSLLAITVIWYLFLFRPQAMLGEHAQAMLDKLGGDIQSIRATEPKIEKLRQRLAVLDSTIALAESKIYSKQQLPEILQQMDRRGREFGLRFLSTFPDYAIMFTEDTSEVSQAGLMRVPVHFIIEGNFLDFGRYLETFPEMPWTITIGGVEIRFWRDAYPKLVIDLIGYIYVYDETKGGRERLRLIELAKSARGDEHPNVGTSGEAVRTHNPSRSVEPQRKG